MCGGTKAPPYEKNKIDCYNIGVPSRHALRVYNKLYINHALSGG